jgi:hypothetical protein
VWRAWLKVASAVITCKWCKGEQDVQQGQLATGEVSLAKLCRESMTARKGGNIACLTSRSHQIQVTSIAGSPTAVYGHDPAVCLYPFYIPSCGSSTCYLRNRPFLVGCCARYFKQCAVFTYPSDEGRRELGQTSSDQAPATGMQPEIVLGDCANLVLPMFYRVMSCRVSAVR